MAKKRTSVIWSITKDDFSELVRNSTSYRQMLGYFNLDNKGGNGKTLSKRIAEENIDDSHIRNRPKTMSAHIANTHSYDEIFRDDSDVGRQAAKSYLVKHNLIDCTHCSKCGKENVWEGEQLVLVLDHINGKSNDNRLENLRFLCPNCNSQMPTFAGRKLKIRHYCPQCGNDKKTKQSGLCQSCFGLNRRIAERPPLDQLLVEIEKEGYCAVGRKYGVSDNAVRKWVD